MHGGYETAEVRVVCGLCRGPGKRVDGVFPRRPQSIADQWTTADQDEADIRMDSLY